MGSAATDASQNCIPRPCLRLPSVLWLAYESQSENPIDRSIRRARKIRMRLGDGRSLVEPLPERPSRKNSSADLQPAACRDDDSAGEADRSTRELPTPTLSRSFEPGEPRQELISVSGTDGGAESPSTCGRFDGTGGTLRCPSGGGYPFIPEKGPPRFSKPGIAAPCRGPCARARLPLRLTRHVFGSRRLNFIRNSVIASSAGRAGPPRMSPLGLW